MTPRVHEHVSFVARFFAGSLSYIASPAYLTPITSWFSGHDRHHTKVYSLFGMVLLIIWELFLHTRVITSLGPREQTFALIPRCAALQLFSRSTRSAIRLLRSHVANFLALVSPGPSTCSALFNPASGFIVRVRHGDRPAGLILATTLTMRSSDATGWRPRCPSLRFVLFFLGPNARLCRRYIPLDHFRVLVLHLRYAHWILFTSIPGTMSLAPSRARINESALTASRSTLRQPSQGGGSLHITRGFCELIYGPRTALASPPANWVVALVCWLIAISRACLDLLVE